eukprot:497447_1
MSSVILLNLIYMINAFTTVRKNISFKMTSAQLPTTSIINPINAFYKDSLYIISSQHNTIYSTSQFTTNNLFNNHSINFQISYSPIDLWSISTSCRHTIQCYDSIDKSIYILIHAESTYQEQPFHANMYQFELFIYDMQNQRSSSSVRGFALPGVTFLDHLGEFITACVYAYNENIYIMGSSFESSLKVFTYNPQLNRWISYQSGYSGFSTIRYGIGCGVYNDLVYLFGGKRSKNVRYGEKCAVEPGLCKYLGTSMQYFRSYFHMSLMLEHYFLIYGGGEDTTYEALTSIEIFDTLTEKFITIIPNNIGTLNVEHFGSLITNDNILVVIGGIYIDNNKNSTQIQYMDLSQLFTEFHLSTQQQCWTSYSTHDQQSLSKKKKKCLHIDDYLITDTNHLIFEIYDRYGEVQMNVKPLGVEYISISLKFSNVSVDITVIVRKLSDVIIPIFHLLNINNLSRLTGIDMSNGHYVMWMKWGPVWKMGFGDIINENRLDMRYSIPATNMNSIKICNGIFSFQSSGCSLNLDIIPDDDVFAVGQNLLIVSNWNLSEATSLQTPIYITSEHIIDMDFVMSITDNGYNFSLCSICHENEMNPDGSCYECRNGIPINDLKTYNKTNNNYKIKLWTEFDGLYPKEQSVTLHRLIQEVQFIIENPWLNDSYENLSFSIHPNAGIFVIPIYNITNVVQPNGNFIIQFDPDFTFKDNMGMIWVDFTDGTCNIAYDYSIIDCEEPIIIPNSMVFKERHRNNYTVTISSWDSNILGQASFEFLRYIQSLDVMFSDEIYLGERIIISVNVLDDNIYQNSSSIVVSNPQYGIYSIINVIYDYRTTNRVKCAIHTIATESTVSCKNGLIFLTSNSSIVSGTLTLHIESNDTILKHNYISIKIKHCPIGYGLIGHSRSFYICDECPVHTVSLSSNSSICIDCIHTPNIVCNGKSELILSYNHWISIESMLTQYCAPGYCCSNKNGCNYMENQNELCGPNRDVNIILCGSCVLGYSEVFGSVGCKQCIGYNYWIIIVVFIFSVFVILIFILLSTCGKSADNNDGIELNYKILLFNDEVQGLQICLFRILIYFFQSLTYVTINTGFNFWFSSLINILSFDIIYSLTPSNEILNNTNIYFDAINVDVLTHS